MQVTEEMAANIELVAMKSTYIERRLMSAFMSDMEFKRLDDEAQSTCIRHAARCKGGMLYLSAWDARVGCTQSDRALDARVRFTQSVPFDARCRIQSISAL